MIVQYFGFFVYIDGVGYCLVIDDEIIVIVCIVFDVKIKCQGSVVSLVDVKVFVFLWLGNLLYEVFVVVFVDVQFCIIDFCEMFWGMLIQVLVYLCEIVKEVLQFNVVVVFLMYNYLSGVVELLCVDEMLMQMLKLVLVLVDVCVLDYLVVVGG